MIFTGINDPFGTAPAFQSVAWPMPELQNKKLVRKAKRSLRKLPRAPKPPSQTLKNFLLTYDK